MVSGWWAQTLIHARLHFPMTPLLFIVGCLATFRLSLLLSKEDGPAWIFRKIRNTLPKKSSLHDGVRCIWCTGVWMSAIVTTFFAWHGEIEWIEWPLYWLAFAAGGLVINQQFTKDSK